MKTRSAKHRIPKGEMTASKFIALPDDEKERIYQELDSMTPEEIYAKSRPMNAQEKAQWRRIQKKIRRGRGRPLLGNGVQKVSVSVERTLLGKADAFAKTHKLNRSELFSKGVASFIAASKSNQP
jgi:hypothetical protein